jgi:hypothetical protein
MMKKLLMVIGMVTVGGGLIGGLILMARNQTNRGRAMEEGGRIEVVPEKTTGKVGGDFSFKLILDSGEWAVKGIDVRLKYNGSIVKPGKIEAATSSEKKMGMAETVFRVKGDMDDPVIDQNRGIINLKGSVSEGGGRSYPRGVLDLVTIYFDGVFGGEGVVELDSSYQNRIVEIVNQKEVSRRVVMLPGKYVVEGAKKSDKPREGLYFVCDGRYKSLPECQERIDKTKAGLCRLDPTISEVNLVWWDDVGNEGKWTGCLPDRPVKTDEVCSGQYESQSECEAATDKNQQWVCLLDESKGVIDAINLTDKRNEGKWVGCSEVERPKVTPTIPPIPTAKTINRGDCEGGFGTKGECVTQGDWKNRPGWCRVDDGGRWSQCQPTSPKVTDETCEGMFFTRIQCERKMAESIRTSPWICLLDDKLGVIRPDMPEDRENYWKWTLCVQK